MKLYKIKTKEKESHEESITFNVMANDVVSALKKFKQIPDIDYLYFETKDELIISCEGDVI